MKPIKKISVALAFVILLLSAMAMSTFAGNADGTCGQNAKWHYDAKTQTLTISGTGSIYNYDKGTVPRYFADCDNIIKNVVIKEGITGIGNYAFALNGETIEKVALPKSLKTIGEGAFGSTSIKKITIPSGVTTIGEYAFLNCDKLASVTIPDSVKTLGAGAFYYCTNLSSVKIGNGVTKIYADTFSGCESLTVVSIGKNVSKIGALAFSEPNRIRTFKVDSGNNYFSVDQYGVLYNKNKTYLKLFPAGNILQSFTVPDSVIKIADSAFYGASNLVSVKMGKKLETIGKYAFYSCENLKTVSLNSGLKTIDEQAFAACYKIKEIKIPSTVSSIHFTALSDMGMIKVDEKNKVYSSDAYGVLFDKAKTELISYPNSNTRKSYPLPDSVKRIQDSAFEYNKYIESIELPKNLEYIGDCAFSECEKLTSVTIPKSVKIIGHDAFSYCPYLNKLIIEEGSEAEIGMSAFLDCSTLISISISSKISKISSGAFGATPGYDDAKENSPYIYYIGNVLYEAWDESGKMKTLKVKEGTLGISSVYGSALSTVELPASLKNIEESAFSDCENLKSIKVADGNQNFVTDSRGVLFNKDKTRLIVYAQAKNYTSYTIPASVNTVDDGSFTSGASLQNITVEKYFPDYGSGKFYGTKAFSDQVGEVYMNNVYFGYEYDGDNPAPYVEIIKDGTKAIGAYAIADSNFLAVYIPKSVKYIAENSLYQTDIYYQGSEAEWKAISGNLKLESCTIQYNFNKNSHTHKYYWQTVQYPTCTDKGLVDYVCPCGHKVEKSIPANGHITYYIGIVTATTYSDGLKEKYCIGCGKAYNSLKTVPRIESIKLAETKMVYDGSLKKPEVIVKDAKGNVLDSYQYYTIYSYDCDQIGQHTVDVEARYGSYDFYKELSYTVLPGKTSKLTATANHNAIALKWNPVPGATGYKIYVSVQGKWQYLKTTSATECRMDNLQTGKTYKYAVKAFTKVGNKVYDAADFAVISKSTHLTAPKITASSNSKGTTTLKWTVSPGAAEYLIYVKENGTWKYIDKTKGNSATEYTVKGLKSGAVQTFAVRPIKYLADKTVVKGVYGTAQVKIK